MTQVHKKVRSKKITRFAKGRPCTLRLDGVCAHVNFSKNAGRDTNFETSIWAHLPGHSKGVSTKENDNHGCIACFFCHDVIDMRNLSQFNIIGAETVYRAMLRAISESQALLIQEGVMKIADHEVHR